LHVCCIDTVHRGKSECFQQDYLQWRDLTENYENYPVGSKVIGGLRRGQMDPLTCVLEEKYCRLSCTDIKKISG
jgi:hypothetical protein